MDRQLTTDGREEEREPMPEEAPARPEALSLFTFPQSIAGQLAWEETEPED
jgi:hypothetical protein